MIFLLIKRCLRLIDQLDNLIEHSLEDLILGSILANPKFGMLIKSPDEIITLQLVWGTLYLLLIIVGIDQISSTIVKIWNTAQLKSLFCIAVDSELVHGVVVSAASLLLLVYEYLIGHVDKGGTLTCSTGSFQFRAAFISIVLFEGAYVWIKFRDVASFPGGGYRRPLRDKLTGAIIKHSKPEARYTPPRQSGNSLYLGVCATDEEARIKKHIAAFYYDKAEGLLDVGHGDHFQIPRVQMAQDGSLSMMEKRKWVRDKVKVVYESFLEKQKDNFGASHPPSEVDAGDYCTFLKEFVLKSPSDMTFDSQPQQQQQQHQQQHVQVEPVQASAMVVPTFGKQGDSPFHAEPLESAYSWGSQEFLDVAAFSSDGDCELNVNALTVEQCAPQKSSNGREFPIGSSLFTPQPGMDPLAALSDVVTPPLNDFCRTDSTPNVLSMKVINLLEQKIQDQEQKIQERDRKIVELELENERLRALT